MADVTGEAKKICNMNRGSMSNLTEIGNRLVNACKKLPGGRRVKRIVEMHMELMVFDELDEFQKIFEIIEKQPHSAERTAILMKSAAGFLKLKERVAECMQKLDEEKEYINRVLRNQAMSEDEEEEGQNDGELSDSEVDDDDTKEEEKDEEKKDEEEKDEEEKGEED